LTANGRKGEGKMGEDRRKPHQQWLVGKLTLGAGTLLLGALLASCSNGDPQAATQPAQPVSPATDLQLQQAGTLATLWNCDSGHRSLGALQLFGLDQQPALVIDGQALLGLDELLNHGALSSAELERALGEIERCLPEAQASELRGLATDYHGYLQASIELQALYPPQSEDAGQLRQLHDELIALQADFLGEERANELFGERNRASRYMLELMLLDRDAGLSDEERAARQAEIDARFGPDH
jgi:hypothetical protein